MLIDLVIIYITFESSQQPISLKEHFWPLKYQIYLKKT